jgi:hypothetical protein
MGQVENYGYAKIYLNKGNEKIYAEEENLQHNGDYPTRGRAWLAYPIFFAVLARRTQSKGDILTKYWYMIAINSTSTPGK